MKKILTIVLAILFTFQLELQADEGMWLPIFIKRLNYTDMQKMGCKLTPEEIYDINHSSIKDAVVMFGRGCTAEIISSKGLLITNHHCGLRQIQSHSSVENDYVKNGFWAKNNAEELLNENLTVSFLIRIEDVTEKILSELNDEMKEKNRQGKINDISGKLESEAVKGSHYKAKVQSFFEGNEFYLFVYEIFRDVRLVGTPPWAIGKFGADTDNWMWPRHKGDFCLFRVYTGPDGKPAEYSDENIPLKPKHHFPISLKGVKKDDFTMIMGYPGGTDRFLTSDGVKIAIELTGPTYVEIREKKLEIMKMDMDADEEVRIKYTAKQASTSNYWKYFIGQTQGLKRLHVYEKKKEIERKFSDWVYSNSDINVEYRNALKYTQQAYKIIEKYKVADIYHRDGIQRGSEIIPMARYFHHINNAVNTKDKDEAIIDNDKVRNFINNHFKNYNVPTDKKIFAALMKMYYENVNKELLPDIFQFIEKKFKGNFEEYADYVFSKSIFTDKSKVMAYIDNPKSLDKDPAFIAMTSLYAKHKEILKLQKDAEQLLDKGNRLYVAGLREMLKEKTFYPNANFTMRLTYGKVGDYYPRDAVYYDYITTLEGVMEKEIHNDWEFDVPPKLKELYEKKDYGIYGENGKMIVNFTTNNDITGGNSGSPVIDGEGNLIGLAFDGNWEAMSGDIAFEPELQKTICVDIRYVLFVIDKFAGAKHLVDEMTLVKIEK